MNIIFVFRPLFETAFHQQGPEAVGGMIGAMAGTVGGVFGMIYPILLLVFMTRPKVVRAFGLPAN